jgi:hypothetical protein
MPTKIIEWYELKANDIICSMYSRNENKWIRDMNNIYIDQLKVMRIFNENKKWVLYLYEKNRMNSINIFYINSDIYEKVAIYI